MPHQVPYSVERRTAFQGKGRGGVAEGVGGEPREVSGGAAEAQDVVERGGGEATRGLAVREEERLVCLSRRPQAVLVGADGVHRRA